MRGIGRFWVLAALLLTLNAGALFWIRQEVLQRLAPTTSDDAVLVALTTREPQTAERLTFDFDKPVKGAVALDEPVVNAPLLIQPQPLGYWQWQSAQRLDYVLAEPLPAGRKYRVVPAAYFVQETGQDVQVKGDAELQTPALEVLASRFSVADRETATLEFEFNQPVDPGDFLLHLAVHDIVANRKGKERIGESLAVTMLDKKPNKTLRVQVARPSGLKLMARVSENLTGRGAELGLKSVYEHEFEITKRFSLLHAEAQYSYSASRDRDVRLAFSNSLLRTQKFDGIKVTPAVEGLRVRVQSWDHAALVMSGPFESGVNYSIEVPGTLLNDYERPLGIEQATTVVLPPRNPVVKFANEKGFLSPHGNLLVDVSTASVTGLKLEVSRVHENNLLAHLDGLPSTRTSRALIEKTLPVAASGDQWHESLFDLKELLAGQRGIYRLRAAATNSAWTADECVVSVTDIALTSKTERDGVVVLATSLRSAQPMEGVRLVALSPNNQTLVTAETAANGVARLAFDPQHPDGRPFVLMATKNDDASYLQLDESQWVLDEVDQKGKPIPTSYDVLLYTERGVYRPGETLHVSGVIRDANGKTPESFPLQVTVARPDGRVFSELSVTPKAGEQGTFQFDVPTRDSSQTGPYRLKVTLPGSDDVLGSTRTLVEAFEPVRIEVAATSEKSLWQAGETPVLNIDAKYLFGQPAAGLKVVVSGEFRRGEFVSKEVRGFKFADSSKHRSREVPTIAAELDEAGKLRLEMPLPKELDAGWWGGNFIATVTEEGGRSISKPVSITVDSAGRHVGIKSEAANGTAEIGKPLNIEWAVRTGLDAAAEPGVVKLELARIEYDWNWRRRDNGGVNWEHTERPIVIKTVTTDGAASTGTAAFDIPEWGSYRLTATDERSGNASVISFYGSGGYGESSQITSNRPERVELILDQASYEPGKTAKLLIRSPFKGTGWICLEADRVRQQQFVTLTGASTSVEVPIPADLRGGAFLTATVIRPVDPTEKTWLPHRAAGMTRLVLDHKAQQLPVSIEAPSQARPGESVTIVAKVGGASSPSATQTEEARAAGDSKSEKDERARSPFYKKPMLHLWAVDEGVLQTTGFKTPDAHQHFFAPRRSEIASADIFRDLLPDHQRAAGMQRIGGDASETEEQARGVSPSRKRESVVVWRKWVPVDESGSVTIDAQLPEHTGRLRWMAVAIADDSYGRSEFGTTLTAPLLVETSWPRFAAPGDRLEVPVKLFNATTQPLEVSLGLQSSGPLSIAPRGELSKITVAPQQPQVVWLDVSATGLGLAEVTVTGTAKSAEFGELAHHQSVKLPVRALTAFGSDSRIVSLKAGEKLTLDVPVGFIAEQSKQTLTVGPTPLLQLLPAAEALIDYPYGCAEQTSSRMSGLLAAARVLEIEAATRRSDAPSTQPLNNEARKDSSVRPASNEVKAGGSDESSSQRSGEPHRIENAIFNARRTEIDEMLDAGVARLWSYQTQSGAIGYWGGARGEVWLSAYVAGILADVKQFGRPVPERFSDELLKYLSASLDGRNGVELDANTRAAICRVLAVYQKAPLGWMAKLSEQAEQLDAGAKADLARAWLAAGRRDRAAAVLGENPLTNLTQQRSYFGRLTSPLCQQAAILRTLVELDPRDSRIPALVKVVEAGRVNGVWLSTIENATALSALAAHQATLKHEPADFKGIVRTGMREPTAFDHLATKTLRFEKPLSPLQLETTGKGECYVTLTTSGLRTNPHVADAGLQVRRKWFDRTGKEIDPQTIQSGDLITVEVELRSLTQDVPNVVVVDSLPSGFEVENPRLATSANQTEEQDENSRPDRTEFLDDRVLIFTTAHLGHSSKFRYLVRATTLGQFDAPGIQAVSMYSPDLVSVAAGAAVTISK